MMEEETNKGHGKKASVMTSLRRVLSKKVPASVLEEMRPMMASSTSSPTAPTTPSKHSKPPRSKTLEFSLRDKTDATAKRGFRVQVPKRLLLYTIIAFFVFPLLLGVIVGTRRIHRMHAGFHDDEGEPVPDFWGQEEEQAEQSIDLQTVVKSSNAAVNATQDVEEENEGEEQQPPESNAEGNVGENAEEPKAPIDAEATDEKKPEEEEQADANIEEGAPNEEKDAKAPEQPEADNNPAPNDTAEKADSAEGEHNEAAAEVVREDEPEAPRIDQQVAPNNDGAKEEEPQTDAHSGDQAPEANAEERRRSLRGSRQ